MDSLYAVVVTGALQDNVTQEQARRFLAERYGLAAQQINLLLSGKRVVVKRNVDRATAVALARKFQAAGLVCGVSELQRPEAASPPPTQPEAAPPPPPPAADDDDDWPASARLPNRRDDDDDDWPPRSRMKAHDPPPPPQGVVAPSNKGAVAPSNMDDDWPPRAAAAPHDDDDDDWPPRSRMEAHDPTPPHQGAVAPSNMDDDWPPPEQDAPPPAAQAAAPGPASSGEPDPGSVVPMVLARYGELKGAYPQQTAPPKMFANALTACFLTDEQPIHGILDTSIGKSGKECLVFAEDGINYSMGKKKKGFIPYTEFMHMELEVLDANNLLIGGEHNLLLSWGMPIRPGEAQLLLQDLQEALKGSASGASMDEVADGIGNLRVRPPEADKAVAFIMGPYVGKQGIHVTPDIPPKCLREARQHTSMDRNEEALAIISLKIMGGCGKFLMITDQGLHYYQSSIKRGFMHYRELPSLEFTRGNFGEIKLDSYAVIDISATPLKWYQLTALLGAMQDYALTQVLRREPFKEPPKARIRCPRCASANLGLATKKRLSYTWGFVGYFVASPIPVVGASAAAAKTMAEAFGKTVYYIACRNCGHGWVDKTNAAKGEKEE